MIRRATIYIGCSILFVAFAGPVEAQPRDKIQVQSVRVGFPPGPQTLDDDEKFMTGPRDSLYKAGAWIPVYVTLNNVGKYDPDPKKDGPAVVIVETPDSDDTTTAYSVPVPQFDELEGLAGKANVIAYTRTGSPYGDFTIRVVANGKDLCPPSRPGSSGSAWQGAHTLSPAQGLYVAIGSRLPGLQGLGKRQVDEQTNIPMTQQDRRFAIGLLARIAELPDMWYGYGAVDVLVLSTSDREFATSLINDQVRTAALAEWVRRGGRLIVSGTNADVLAGSANLAAILPVDIGPKYQTPSLNVSWREGGGTISDPLAPADRSKKLSFVRLLPRKNPYRAYRVLVGAPTEPTDAAPVVVQGPYGLGRVTVVAMDLDQPFSNQKVREEFWRQLLARAGPRIPESAGADQYGMGGLGSRQTSSGSGEMSGLRHKMETFEGVPVISFGWVALFILLYILVVGPLDYFILKKVVKRLELTWITFPTVVLAVSAASYFTAYYLKGSDLRINKQDVVDVDLQTGRVYGQSWFAVFSPQIHKFVIGMEPATPWTAPIEPDAPAVTMSWFGEPKETREGLFRHSYDYARQAVGLRGVPIQVWMAKGFEANWAAPIAKDTPIIESGLRHPPGRPDELIGFVTSNLPLPLEDVYLIYRGEVASLGSLLPGTRKAVTAQTRVKFSVLRQDASALDPSVKRTEGVPGTTDQTAALNSLSLNILFHEAWTGYAETGNGGLRQLDQSWRLSDENRDEVILIGRLSQVKGASEAITDGPASSCRLWLGKLPPEGGPRPEISGVMRQDTIVRVFIPLAPEPRAGGQ